MKGNMFGVSYVRTVKLLWLFAALHFPTDMCDS